MHKSNKKKKQNKNRQSTNSDKLKENEFVNNAENQKLPYTIRTSEIMGRYVTASKDIKLGEKIISEIPIIVGPLNSSGIVCLGCYIPINEDQFKQYKCKFCSWPICSNKCKGLSKNFGHSKYECNIFKEKNIEMKLNFDDYVMIANEYCAITPLRCLLLKYQKPKCWQQLLQMESHNKIRRELPELWNGNQMYVVDRIRHKWGFIEFSDDEIHTICGILEVNAFEIGHGDITLRAIYPTAFLLSHDCIPNTTHIDDEESFKITIRSTVAIRKDQPITLSYVNTLQSTLKRQQSLLENKFFLCQCQRCSDPTELGTYLSALKCPKCSTGFVLSINPLDAKAMWKCTKSGSGKSCSGYSISSDAVCTLMERIETEINQIHCNDIEGYEDFLKRYCNVLHPAHYHFLNVKHNLSQLYGKIVGYIIHELSEELLNRKIEICREILTIFDVIEPGYSRIRGITLYELHAPLMILAGRDFESQKISKLELKTRLKEIVNCLKEASIILSFEPKSTSEGLMADAAKDALNKISNWQTIIGKI